VEKGSERREKTCKKVGEESVEGRQGKGPEHCKNFRARVLEVGRVKIRSFGRHKHAAKN